VVAEPLPMAWFSGVFQPLAEVRISPLDRAFLFGDAVYEVIPVFGGRVFLLEAHLDRLERSLGELRIRNPHTRAEWTAIVKGLLERNPPVSSAAIYLQVSRGADIGRDHGFPADTLRPTEFGMVSPVPAPSPDSPGIAAITLPDTRWARCDIKSTALLANLLARQAAREAGAQEAILVRDGWLTEGSASSVILVESGKLARRPEGPEVLPGTTAEAVMAIAGECGLPTRIEPIRAERLATADEVWVLAATRGIAPVVQLDGRKVGTGQPGSVWRTVAQAFQAATATGRPR
jgi:D-alanine transaminase